ncbi:hypothetical protein EVB55_086 [Rhizobium phage RHph_Y68]|uniref:Uncharacterized protein n=1 Tax=Rhizobium phage RHph_Y68 TaxID=2509787 RepID=A0A7S5QY29_9CAUD|nr:hypothetical protein PP934_gp086 [Rhizobium phage RHph_Y68]QIG68021.1 hypothetical protein EVB55_086 [Rhizobium phage RHph_Y68]
MKLAELNLTQLSAEQIDDLHKSSGFEGNTIFEARFLRYRYDEYFLAFEYFVKLRWKDTGETEDEIIYVALMKDGTFTARYEVESIHHQFRNKSRSAR